MENEKVGGLSPKAITGLLNNKVGDKNYSERYDELPKMKKIDFESATKMYLEGANSNHVKSNMYDCKVDVVAEENLFSKCKTYLVGIGFAEIENDRNDPVFAHYEYIRSPIHKVIVNLQLCMEGPKSYEVEGSVIVRIDSCRLEEEDCSSEMSAITIVRVEQLEFLVEKRRQWRLWHLPLGRKS